MTVARIFFSDYGYPMGTPNFQIHFKIGDNNNAKLKRVWVEKSNNSKITLLTATFKRGDYNA